MADRDVAKTQSTTRVTTTSASYQDGITLTWTPAAGAKDYWLLWAAIGDCNSTTIDLKCRFYNSTAASDLCVQNVEPKDTTDRISVFGIAKWTSPSTPVSQSFKIQYASETSGTTSGVDEMCVVALESHTSDQYIETDAETTTTSSTYQDAQTLTFTPATTGDYLIFAYGEYTNSSASTGRVQLLVDSVASFETSPFDLTDTTNYTPWMAVYKVNLDANSHTLKIQYRSNGSATAGIRRRRILAIRLDTLRSLNSDFTATRATTTSTTAIDAATTTFTAAGSIDYLAISNIITDGNSTSASIFYQINMNGTVAAFGRREPQSTTSRRVVSSMAYSAFAAGSSTVKAQVYADTGITVGYGHSGIYVLDLREASAGGSATNRPMRAAMVVGGFSSQDQFSAGQAHLGWGG